MRKQISQRMARYYKRRVEELESSLRVQKNRWAREWSPGWVNIETLTLTESSYAKLATARLLGYAVVAVPTTDNKVMIYADRL